MQRKVILRETAAGLRWKDERSSSWLMYLTPRERRAGCSPRQTAMSDALFMMGGAPVQQVSQMSLYNLPTLEGEDKQQTFTPRKPFPASCSLAESDFGHFGQHFGA